MRTHLGAIAWFIIGAAVGFGALALALASLGAIVLLPALAIGVLLLVLRIRPVAMLLVGAGSGVAVPWVLHITSGDTPDSELWPVFVGLALLATGLFMFFTQKPRTEASAERRREPLDGPDAAAVAPYRLGRPARHRHLA